MLVLVILFGSMSNAYSYEWPVESQIKINGTFGEFRKTDPAPHFHSGTDVSTGGNSGVRLKAIIPGTVRYYNNNSSKTFVITNENEEIWYYHSQLYSNLENTRVERGDYIGISSEYSGGPHLHIEKRIGNKVLNILSNGGLNGYSDNKFTSVCPIRNGEPFEFYKSEDVIDGSYTQVRRLGRSNGVINVSQTKLHIVVKAADRKADQLNTDDICNFDEPGRQAPYEICYNLQNRQDGSLVFGQQGKCYINFDSLLDPNTDDLFTFYGLSNIYDIGKSGGSNSKYFYSVTNKQTQFQSLDLSSVSRGRYDVIVWADDFDGGGYDSNNIYNISHRSGRGFEKQILEVHGDIILPPTSLDIPTNINATDGTFANKVEITWQSNNSSYYELYRCISDSISGCGSPIYSGVNTQYTDTDIDTVIIYNYRVKACNSDGSCSGFSKLNSGYANNDIVIPLAPTAPSNIVASNGTYSNSIRVSWNEVSNATRYEIYRCNSPKVTSCGNHLVRNNPFDDTDVISNETFYYRVKACNNNGCSEYSNYDSGYIGEVVSSNNSDLVSSTPIISDTNPYTNQQISFSFNVRNIGEGNSDSTAVTYHLATNENINSNDLELGTENTPAITVFEGQNSHSFNFYAPGEAGQFWVGACITPVANEISTSNNCTLGIEINVQENNNGGTDTGEQDSDLVITNDLIDEDQVTQGQRVSVEATVKNIGEQRSEQVAIRFFLSVDKEVTVDDIEVGGHAVLGINGNNERTDTGQITIPDIEGIYWFGACVDSYQEEAKSDNNCSISTTRVEVGGAVVTETLRADLTVRDMLLDKYTYNENESLIISFKVINIGEFASRSVNIDGYIGTDFNKVKNKVFATSTNNGVDVQSSEYLTRTIDLSGFETGNYFFTLDIDNENFEVESNKANNRAELAFEIIENSSSNNNDSEGSGDTNTDDSDVNSDIDNDATTDNNSETQTVVLEIDTSNLEANSSVSTSDQTLIYSPPETTVYMGSYSSGEIVLTEEKLKDIVPEYIPFPTSLPKNILNFSIKDLVNTSDGSEVILKLASGIPSFGTVYIYKRSIGWRAFIVDGNNKIESSISIFGNCINDTSWKVGVFVASNCIKLTIEDGGVNDLDSTENQELDILIAFSKSEENNVSEPELVIESSSSGGGYISIHVLFVLLLIGLRYKWKFKLREL